MRVSDFPVGYVGMEMSPSPRRTLGLMDTWEVVALVDIVSPDAPYPVRAGKDVRFCRGSFCTVLAGPELRAALERGHVVGVRELHTHRRGRPFGSFCDLVDDMKDCYRSSGNAALLRATKNMANSLHGKFGQWGGGWTLVARDPLPIDWGTWHLTDVHKGEVSTYRALGRNVQRWSGRVERDDNYPLIASYTASYARMLMTELCDVAGYGNVYYQDVDSIHVNKRGYDRLCSSGCIDPHECGRLKVEHIAEWAVWYGPKNYQLGDLRVCAGVSPRAVPGPDGALTQTHWSRLSALIQHAPPDGPVSRGAESPDPTMRIDGVISPDGNVDWPSLP
jgi:hypothetical protein